MKFIECKQFYLTNQTKLSISIHCADIKKIIKIKIIFMKKIELNNTFFNKK